MSSYAIVEACGKQMWIEEGKFYDFDKLPFSKGDVFLLTTLIFNSKSVVRLVQLLVLHSRIMAKNHRNSPRYSSAAACHTGLSNYDVGSVLCLKHQSFELQAYFL